ncbi:hypothetical protein GCM10011386_28920 [Parapedobacter defluvii]|uniref:SGNH/GDSL hydrolase family protein n=1 Tax=Parapedobacter defluvii TaxID=2045106 RepID=A0ABQ1M4W0_9SPHI|nr:SGNH/GDSL hydrolase family protein [Parapedobacter defluvii]GGC34997.1 hypothetical protein GCM10011386_28920 [Parapedobacter defluvii]
MKTNLILVLAMVWITACQTEGRREATTTSTQIVVLGNSIVAHPPNEELGWKGDWGMAASARDSDFVHRLERRMHQVDPGIELQYGSIAGFERAYWNYDLRELAEFRNADILIVKIAENVDPDSLAERQFSQHYAKLIDYLTQGGRTAVIISGGFWPSPVNDTIHRYAVQNGFDFVKLHDLYTSDSTNTAKGLFAHEGVANHPSDRGMKHIADRIWKKLELLIQQH